MKVSIVKDQLRTTVIMHIRFTSNLRFMSTFIILSLLNQQGISMVATCS